MTRFSGRSWLFLGLSAALLLAAHGIIRETLSLALGNPEYSHILLIVPIVVTLVLMQEMQEDRGDTVDLVLGLSLALIAGVVFWRSHAHVFGDASIQLSLSVLSVILIGWSLVLLFYGRNRFRSLMFPMLFLLLVVPLPQAVVAKLTWCLQAGSTQAAYWLFQLFRMPVTRQGFVLSLPQLDIEVAKECSGIRSTVMLLVAALVVGQLFLHSSWRKAILALAVLPIGIVRNGFRVFVLSTLGAYVDVGWLEGNLHHRGGIVFFILGLAVLVALLWWLRRRETSPARSRLGLSTST